MAQDVSTSPKDLEASTEDFESFALGHNITAPSQEWLQCVHGSRKFRMLHLQNCNLSYIHSRAFAEWPHALVRKYTTFVLLSPAIARFSPSVVVCLLVCLSRCLYGRFKYQELVPHKQYFAGKYEATPSCANYVLHTHDVIDDIIRSISRSNIKIAISWSVFIVQRGNKYCHNL